MQGARRRIWLADVSGGGSDSPALSYVPSRCGAALNSGRRCRRLTAHVGAVMKSFGVRDLRERTGDLIRNAECAPCPTARTASDGRSLI